MNRFFFIFYCIHRTPFVAVRVFSLFNVIQRLFEQQKKCLKNFFIYWIWRFFFSSQSFSQTIEIATKSQIKFSRIRKQKNENANRNWFDFGGRVWCSATTNWTITKTDSNPLKLNFVWIEFLLYLLHSEINSDCWRICFFVAVGLKW